MQVSARHDKNKVTKIGADGAGPAINAQTPFRAVRDALAEMEGLAPASVRVVSSGTVVADLSAVVGDNFDKPGVYEWFVESPNPRDAPLRDLEPVSARRGANCGDLCCSKCGKSLGDGGAVTKHDCGCVVCAGCQAVAVAQLPKGKQASVVRCPVHGSDTALPLRLNGKNDPSRVAGDGRPPPSFDALWDETKCRKCQKQTATTRCAYGAWMCKPCHDAHVKKATAEGEPVRASKSGGPFAWKRVHEEHGYAEVKSFCTKCRVALCGDCTGHGPRKCGGTVEELDDPLVLALAAATESRRIQYLQQVLRNAEAAQEVALAQRKALEDDIKKNAALLEANRDQRKKEVHAQFQTPIDELEKQIKALKEQREAICANLDTTTQAELAKMQAEHAADMDTVSKYLQGTEAFREARRDELAMVRQLAANAPEALVVNNMVRDFSGARTADDKAVGAVTLRSHAASADAVQQYFHFGLKGAADANGRSTATELHANAYANLVRNKVSNMPVLQALTSEWGAVGANVPLAAAERAVAYHHVLHDRRAAEQTVVNQLAAVPDAAAAFQKVFDTPTAAALRGADGSALAFVQRAARWLRGRELPADEANAIVQTMGGAAGTHVGWHAAFDKLLQLPY